MRIWRAAKDDIIVDTASFSEERSAAEAYLDNPGYGGPTLYYADVEPEAVLDLTEATDAIVMIMEIAGLSHPGAIGVDEWIPRIAAELHEAGYDWVRHTESYPAGTITWTWIGDSADEPELLPAE